MGRNAWLSCRGQAEDIGHCLGNEREGRLAYEGAYDHDRQNPGEVKPGESSPQGA